LLCCLANLKYDYVFVLKRWTFRWQPCRTISQGQTQDEPTTSEAAVDQTSKWQAVWEDLPIENQVYVKRLPDFCTDKDLEKCFSAVGKVVRCHVVMNNYSNSNFGIGYVALATPEEVQKAISMLNGYEMVIPTANLMFRVKILVIKHRASNNAVFVHGLPFFDCYKNLKILFSSVGKVERIFRGLKDGRLQKFCSVEFSTEQEAQDALEKLDGSYLSVPWVNKESRRRISVFQRQLQTTETQTG